MKFSALWKIFAATVACLAVLMTGDTLLSRNDCSFREEALVRPKVVTPRTHEQVRNLFSALNYNWDTAGEFAPSLLLTSLPPDLDRISNVAEKKRIFFLSMLPAALLANQEIALQRERLISLFQRFDEGLPLFDEETDFIAALSHEYKVAGDPLASPESRTILLKRVDIIPPALILAQAACESGYGTSRFSKLGNNVFGEWSFIPGTGMVPQNRPDGATYEVRRFNTLFEAVRSYLNNLNTHRAYAELRDIRSRLRSEGVALSGDKLAEGLRFYSAQGERYVDHIQKIIQYNELFRFSQTQLLSFRYQA
jgi:Bax protein